jgi:hypothetical protein
LEKKSENEIKRRKKKDLKFCNVNSTELKKHKSLNCGDVCEVD